MNKLKFVCRKLRPPNYLFKNKNGKFLTFKFILFISIITYINLTIGINIEAAVTKTLSPISSVSPVTIRSNCKDKSFNYFNFTLDDTDIDTCLPLSSKANIQSSDEMDNNQITSIREYNPFKQADFITIPFGRAYSYNNLPEAKIGSAKEYTEILSSMYKKLGYINIGIFSNRYADENLDSQLYLFNRRVGEKETVPVIFMQNIFESKNRIWIFRYSTQISSKDATSNEVISFKNIIKDISLNISDKNKISKSSLKFKDYIEKSTKLSEDTNIFNNLKIQTTPSGYLSDPDITTVPWWNPQNPSSCDYINYNNASPTTITSSILQASFKGVQACGPGPDWIKPNTKEKIIKNVYSAFTGGGGGYEWYCVELSMRFMKLIYGIQPYTLGPLVWDPDSKKYVALGYASRIDEDYKGNYLTKLDFSSGKLPQIGDILAIDGDLTNIYGHTSIVMKVENIIGTSETITVLEQNSSASGSKTFTISSSDKKGINGWLHDPSTDAFSADPNPVTTFDSNGLGTTIIKRNTANGGLNSVKAAVFVSIDGSSSETQMTGYDVTDPTPNTATWIQKGHYYIFKLRNEDKTLLMSLQVNTTPNLTPNISNFNIQGTASGTVNLNWGTGDNGGGDIYKQRNNDSPVVISMSQNNLGTKTETIDAGNTYIFTLRRNGNILQSTTVTANGCNPPPTGDFIVSGRICTTPIGTYNVTGNINIASGSLMIVRPDTIINADLINKKITVKNGGGIKILNGGAIK